jgi:pimeloyl-ACP methyl ester carboxylesterase
MLKLFFSSPLKKMHAVILVGGLGNLDAFFAPFKQLKWSPENVRMICVPLEHHSPLSFEAQCKRIRIAIEKCEEAYPNAKISVGGFSTGCIVAMQIVAESRPRRFHRLILLSPANIYPRISPAIATSLGVSSEEFPHLAPLREDAVVPPRKPGDKLQLLADHYDGIAYIMRLCSRSNIVHAAVSTATDWIFGDSDEPAHQRASMWRFDLDEYVNVIRTCLLEVNPWILWRKVLKKNTRVSIVAGDRDHHAYFSRALHSSAKPEGASLCIVPGTHFFLWDDPEYLRLKLLKILS